MLTTTAAAGYGVTWESQNMAQSTDGGKSVTEQNGLKLPWNTRHSMPRFDCLSRV